MCAIEETEPFIVGVNVLKLGDLLNSSDTIQLNGNAD